MDKQLSIKETGKVVIDALREGKKSWSDLKELKINGRKIPDKSLARLLDYLDHWGLVNKENDGYWALYENFRIFGSRKEYDIAIDHSRKLLPALQNMIKITEERHELYPYVKEHLKKGYPDIHSKLEKFETVFDEVRSFYSGLSKMDGALKMDGKVYEELKRKDPLEAAEHRKRTQGFEQRFRGLVAKELVELEPRLMHLLEDGTEEKRVYTEFVGALSVLSSKIEMGEPLEGKCSLCPKVRIQEAENKASKS
jgi:DNA-binding HxlR family transcriptional regulator